MVFGAAVGGIMNKEPPVMHPNQITAIYVQHVNWGRYSIPQLGVRELSIHEWREREIKRFAVNPEGDGI